jgi:hypothetical protein
VGAAVTLKGRTFKVPFVLYSDDGQREVEVRGFDNGTTYLVERERTEGTEFQDRHSGKMVGPFASPEAAEKFIVATDWFRGHT